MKNSRFLPVFILTLALAVAGFQSGTSDGASAETLTLEQETALKALVEDLERLKADPENLRSLQDQIAKEQEEAQRQIEEIDRQIAALQESIAASESTQQELVDRLKALQTGKFLLEDSKASAPPQTVGSPKLTQAEGRISFREQIRPILSNKCFLCHGPDKQDRKAGLRLDVKEEAFKALRSGRHALVPGDVENSQVYHRITASNPADRMPPSDFEKALTPEEISLIVQWIEQGAEWEEHWAFVPPVRPETPAVSLEDWVKNPIDSFILASLEEHGLEPMEEADPRTLLRRASLDLTGLPPTPLELKRFLEDDGPDAYEKAVDRLLDSPHYGEAMARRWLDLARYADTHGFHIDSERTMWRWREWVIDAYNNNKPFDEFTIEQLAGDLLEEPSLDQVIATGFNRNHMINYEGGAIPEEYRVQYVFDRVQTVGTAWMGLSFECAKCHDHKYDPVSQKEFYQVFAFFNSVPEQGLDGRTGNADPQLKSPSPEEAAKLASYDEEIATLQAKLDRPIPELDEAQAEWESEVREKLVARWKPIAPTSAVSLEGSDLEILEDASVLASGKNPDRDVYEAVFSEPLVGVQAIRLEALTDETLAEGGTGRSENANFVLTEFEVELYNPTGDQVNTIPLIEAYADHSQKDFEVSKAIDGNAQTGWGAEGFKLRENRTATFIPKNPISTGSGTELRIRMRHESEFAKHAIGRFRISITTDPAMAPSNLGKWRLSGPYKAVDGDTAYKTAFGPEEEVDLEGVSEDGRFVWIEPATPFDDGKVHNLSGNIAATYLYRTIHAPSARTMTVSVGSNDAVKIWLNNRVVLDKNVQRGVDDQRDAVVLNLEKGENRLLMKVVNYGYAYAFFFEKKAEQVGDYPGEIESILALEDSNRTDEQRKVLREFYRTANSEEWKNQNVALADLRQERNEFEKSIPTTMIMAEMDEPRETFLLIGGQYDQPGEKVEAALPAVFPVKSDDIEPNRLGLAKWLVDESHPLTARVTVNRYWQGYFGSGIVKTAEDFGSQGDWPSHPELLDWLAVEFMESGWDVKHIQRLIVTSAAYRQSSRIEPDRLEKDPANRLISRGPRIRLEAEIIRDNALAVAGLLNRKIGGSSIKPYQPPGLWEEVAYGAGFSAQGYVQDEGSDLYRRGMYVYWKRQAPPPGMLVFDAPNREVCTSHRSTTNTPLQALALMNDPVYLEAARVFAQRIIEEGGADVESRIAYAFERATSRPPSERETEILANVCREQMEDYRTDPEAAEAYISVGDYPTPENVDKVELAAWTTIASMILNLDETITKG